ncbi:non-ribosomal peptide synthetase [Actinokineospora xionganensis]|uniref:non-ribosomal peptide synthetase n=1 Tax=Actinokineospora xionganensis TaxID=2684470 RepID=UPI001C9D5D9C|nr:non-ribosomal peptide synthetase [Actinokineospora xionganensis]
MDWHNGSERGIGTARAASFAQQRLWFLDQLRPGSADYQLPMALRIRGRLDVDALTGAFAAIVDRHEVLRTRYRAMDGVPVEEVDDHVEVVVERVDLAGECDIPALFDRELARPFDLAADPPFRLTLARIAADDHLLLFVVHHIAFDGWSWGILGRELAAGYDERTGGAPAALAPLPLRYGEYADRQRELLEGPRLTRALDYWRGRLAGLKPLRLPTDRPRPAEWDGASDVLRFELPAGLVADIDKLARGHGSTRFMVLLAAFKAQLARYTGQTDIAVGTPVAGRGRVDVEGLIGLFVNTVVLRTDTAGATTFRDLVHRVRDTALTAFTHAELPFERVVGELAPERDMSRNPLFQVTFSLLPAGTEEITLPGLAVELVPAPLGASAFDIVLDLRVRPDGGIGARLQYATALFDEDSVRTLAAGYVRMLETVLAEPEVAVADLARGVEPLPGRERRRLLALGNDTARELPDATLPELITRQALSTPDALAVRSGAVELTYADLEAATNRLAHHLRALGVGPGTLVGVHLDRGIDLLVAFLAVLKTGGAYLPLDPMFPSARLEFMRSDAGAAVVITQEPLAGAFPDVTTVLVDRDRAAIAARPGTTLGHRSGPAELAYVIYTSGSTGTPKGVMIHHRGLANFALSMADRPGVAPGAAVVALTTMSFDPSVLELYVPLLVGGQVVIADTEQARDPERMVRLIADTRPALVQATPTTLRMLVETGWRPAGGLTVLSGGEKLPTELTRALSADGAEVWDLYGPTEITVWATTARLDAEGNVLDWAPAANTVIHLLDGDLEPVGEGAVGEVYIGGDGLAHGYHGRAALTAAAFVPDPHGSVPGARLYRTGDLARRTPAGAVEILGRADHQVKIRGHRMEPGEIEAALLAHDRIRSAVVHPTPTATGEYQLTAYLVGEPPGPDELREFVTRTLPDYMAPAAYVVLDAFPLTASGKVDRKALPVPSAREADEIVAPRTPSEVAVAKVWGDVLGVADVGAHDNFFDLGGHSLLATRVSVRLRSALGIDVPVRALFDHGTVAALAAALPGYPRVSDLPAMPALAPRRRAAQPAATISREDTR